MRAGSAAAIALCLLAAPAVALTPLPPCEVVEGGMRVSNAEAFGYYGSGFVTEEYYQSMDEGAAAVPPQLEGFFGYRLIDCNSREFLAVDTPDRNEASQLLATEFLRNKVQQEKPFTMADVNRAVQALYKGRNVNILTLRETEQTCSCDYYGGQ